MDKSTIEKGPMQTVELEETDFQRLGRIAQHRGYSVEQVLHEVLEQAESDDTEEEASDEGVNAAFRSPEVQEMLAKVDKKFSSKKP